jgi:hypothetical protein
MTDPLLVVSWAAVLTGVVCSVAVVIDVLHRPQQMWIMNVVWPVTALYSGPLGLATYLVYGRRSTRAAFARAGERHEEPPAQQKPFPAMTVVAATHCGAGCTLGDLVAESFVVAVPITFLGSRLFGTWLIDYICAFAIGVAFQYFTIVPMRHLTPGKGVLAALKADALSLSAWQVGMYGWMAIAVFGIFGRELPKTSAVFWFMMQLAMLAGFATSYPVNWWLLRAGVKEKM